MSHYRKKDPFRKREAAEYKHPVASREFIMQYLTDAGRPLGWQALCEGLGIQSEEEQEGMRRRLKAMVRDGQLMKNRRGCYALVQKLELVPGRVQAHRDGFGFLIPDDGGSDIFLPAREMDAVFNDDRVLVRVVSLDAKGRREGQIAEILEYNTHQVVGKYREENGIAFVDPDNKFITQDIIIPENQQSGAKNGQFVVVEITSQPTKRRQPLGKVIEILGDQLTAGMEIELAIRSHALPFTWPELVINESQQFPATVSFSQHKGYTDLRNLAFVTIDGEDAKDFDDAVFCQRLDSKAGGWRLIVAIADVAEYVKPGSALDIEAKNRGNSVYFPNKVLPMLPETLSNGLCSLKPEVDRLALVCDMQIEAQGEIADYQFYEGVIHSKARLTYTQTVDILENSAALPKPAVLSSLKEFHELFKKLLRQRQLRGAIDFETVDTKILFREHGKIDRIVVHHRNVAHRMIEEAMLSANVCAAHFLKEHELTTLYRVHEGPESQRLLALRDFLKPFNLRLSGGKKPTPKDYAKLLERINGRPDAHLLQTVLLRSLRQAIYSPENSGHFGLAYEAYTHFTSPIRRYPDLLVHRGIKHLIRKKAEKEFPYPLKTIQEIGQHCSMTERRADLATRDAIDWLKCEYMLNKQGQIFPGIISDVTSFGVFVELNDIYVQGLLHITALNNDYYHYDAVNHLLQGRQSNHTYRLGDPIEVLVARVDIDKRLIDFELPAPAKKDEGGQRTTAKRRRRRKR
jgi:ribonuclease R